MKTPTRGAIMPLSSIATISKEFRCGITSEEFRFWATDDSGNFDTSILRRETVTPEQAERLIKSSFCHDCDPPFKARAKRANRCDDYYDDQHRGQL